MTRRTASKPPKRKPREWLGHACRDGSFTSCWKVECCQFYGERIRVREIIPRRRK